jgi:predicted amidohydrolase YtcJ
MARLAETGVTACIQPSFAVTDVGQLRPALGPDRHALAYPWAPLLAAGVAVVAGSDYPVEALEPLVGLARLVGGRSDRDGFASAGTAPPPSRLSAATALDIMTDEASGLTMLTADPRRVAPGDIDGIRVTGTVPLPF